MQTGTPQQIYGPMVARTFRERGFPGSWGMAIAKHESDFTPTAINRGAGDIERGGAWGMCQITHATAKGLGYKGADQGLLDPLVNVTLAAGLFRANQAILGVTGRSPDDFRKLAAAYNCGPEHVLHDTIPAETLNEYLPRVCKLQQDFARYDAEA